MAEVWDQFLVIIIKILEIGNWVILVLLTIMHIITLIIFTFNINRNTFNNVFRLRNPFKESLGFSILIGMILLWIIHLIFGFFLNQIGFIIIIFLDILLPSVFGLAASTNVGVNVGLNGVSFGFIFYSLAFSGNLIFWREKSWVVFIVTITAFIAGWFGGWIAKGQYKHSFATSIFEIEAICQNSEIRSCSEIVIKNVKNKIIEIYEAKFGGKVKYLNGNYFETTDHL